MLADDLEKTRPELEVDRLVADALKAGEYRHTVSLLWEKMISLEKKVDEIPKEGQNTKNTEDMLDRERFITLAKRLSHARAWSRTHPDLSMFYFGTTTSLTEGVSHHTSHTVYSPKNRVLDTNANRQRLSDEHSHFFAQDMKAHDKSAEMKIRELEAKVRFLENQLQNDKPHLQIYRLGAGSFLVATLSLLLWMFIGIAAPFHPIFAALVVPAALGVMAMAFLIRRDENPQGK